MEIGAGFALLVAVAVFLGLLMFGLPVGFAMGGGAILGYLLMDGPQALMAVALNTWQYMTSYLLVACLMFYIMAEVLTKTGMADALFDMAYRWLSSLNGSLAMGVVVVCAIFAAMSGVGTAAIVVMGLIALPPMLKRHYSKDIALGSIAAGAPLGVLIPPSVVMIFYGLFTGVSIGRLFIAGVFPGILLALLYITYIGIRCWRNPSLGPAIPPEERPTWGERFVSIRAAIPPIFIIFLVLGTIYLGVATPTEASGIGALGVIIASIINRRFSWKMLWESGLSATRLLAMVMWLAWGGILLGTLLTSSGIPQAAQSFTVGLEVNRWVIFAGMMLLFFILGMFVDVFVIIMIVIGPFYPIILSLGFDPLWFALVFMVNTQTGWITPPFGFSLYVLKAVVPKDIGIEDIIHSVWPFIGLQLVGLVLCIFIPPIIMWLPGMMIGK